jgi:hypothetical protein
MNLQYKCKIHSLINLQYKSKIHSQINNIFKKILDSDKLIKKINEKNINNSIKFSLTNIF